MVRDNELVFLEDASTGYASATRKFFTHRRQCAYCHLRFHILSATRIRSSTFVHEHFAAGATAPFSPTNEFYFLLHYR